MVFVFGIVYLSKLYFCLSISFFLYKCSTHETRKLNKYVNFFFLELCSSGLGELIVVLDQCFATTMQQINRREREIDHLLDLCLRCSPALSPARSPARPPARSPARSPPLSPARSPARKSGPRCPAGSAPGSVVTGDGPSAHISIV